MESTIKERRSIFPNQFTGEVIPDAKITELLELAHWAPSHRKTFPWRFHVIGGEAKIAFAEFLANTYKNTAAKFSEFKYNKLKKKVLNSSHIVVINMQPDPEKRVPEWEELAATAMAVQNLWLGATAKGLGGYWSSPSLIDKIPSYLKTADSERCLGLFYLGVPGEAELVKRERPELINYVKWV